MQEGWAFLLEKYLISKSPIGFDLNVIECEEIAKNKLPVINEIVSSFTHFYKSINISIDFIFVWRKYRTNNKYNQTKDMSIYYRRILLQ